MSSQQMIHSERVLVVSWHSLFNNNNNYDYEYNYYNYNYNDDELRLYLVLQLLSTTTTSSSTSTYHTLQFVKNSYYHLLYHLPQ